MAPKAAADCHPRKVVATSGSPKFEAKRHFNGGMKVVDGFYNIMR